jgi:hypothetical protein
MQAAGRGAASAARPDVTDPRRSAADRAAERRQDAAERPATRLPITETSSLETDKRDTTRQSMKTLS